MNEPDFPKAVLSNFVTDLSPFAQAGADILHVPDAYTNTFSAQTQSTQGNAVVDASPATVDTTLTINTHKYVAWIIGDLTMQQIATIYSLNEIYAREAQNLLIQELEDSLFALWSSVTTNTVGDTATVLTDLEMRQAIEKLDALNVDITETAFFVHPTVYWNQLAGITKYYQNDISELALLRTGNFGPFDMSRGLRGAIYDQPVFVSTRVVSGLQTYRNLFLHPRAFGFAVQTRGANVSTSMGEAPQRVRVQAQYLLQNLGTLTVADIIYGVAVLREPYAVLVNANTTSTTS